MTGRWILPQAAAILAALLLLGCGRIPRIIVLTDPLSAKEHLELGVSYERKGEPDLAAREYERALRKDRSLVQARINLGNVHLAKGKYPEAKEEYRKVLSAAPGHPEAANNFAWAAILSGSDREEAAERMEEVLSKEEARTPPLLDTLGVLRMRLRRPGAGDLFEEAERRCLQARTVAGEGPGKVEDRDCPDAVLAEIRRHREEHADRDRSPPPPALVQ